MPVPVTLFCMCCVFFFYILIKYYQKYYSIVGRGSGSFIGGHLIKWVGIRQAFRLMGLAAMISGGMYVLIHIAWLRKFDTPAMEDEDMLGTQNTIQPRK